MAKSAEAASYLVAASSRIAAAARVGPVGWARNVADVGRAEVDEGVPVERDRAGGAVGARVDAQGGELHELVPSTCTRCCCRASKMGVSLKRNRSSAPESESVLPASERTENGCHDGTTNRSPRVTVHCWVPTLTTAGAVEDLVDRRADLAAGSGLGAAADAVHLGADRGQHVATGGRVGEADDRVAGLDGARVALGLELELVGQGAVGVLPAVGEQGGAGAGGG